MSIKKIVKQKQRQKQSIVVNVNLAKARARASAKRSGKSGGRGGGRGFMLPPPIYVSPIDRLTPAMYNSQSQQIKQQSIDELLKNFLSNQQNQQVGSFKSLGAPPASIASSIPSSNATANSSSSSRSLTDYGLSNSPSLNSLAYFANQHSDSSLSSDNSLRTKTPSTSIYSTIGSSIDASFPDNVSELSDGSYMSDTSSKNRIDKIIEEARTYLKASESNDDINVPKFSQNEARVSQGNIYESARRPDTRRPVIIPNEDDSTTSSAPVSRPMYRQVSEDTDNPYPETLYNKMMGFTQS